MKGLFNIILVNMFYCRLRDLYNLDEYVIDILIKDEEGLFDC